MLLIEYLVLLLVLLVVVGVPIAFGARWLVTKGAVSRQGDSREFPTREQFTTLVDQVESLSDRLEDMEERQAFLERLLEPRKNSPVERIASGDSGDSEPKGPGVA